MLVKFECGHQVVLPHTPVDAKWDGYWATQSLPRIPGGVARCPGCITARRPQGDVQRVIGIDITLPEGQML